MDKQKADELIFSYVRKIFGFAMSKLSKNRRGRRTCGRNNLSGILIYIKAG